MFKITLSSIAALSFTALTLLPGQAQAGAAVAGVAINNMNTDYVVFVKDLPSEEAAIKAVLKKCQAQGKGACTVLRSSHTRPYFYGTRDCYGRVKIGNSTTRAGAGMRAQKQTMYNDMCRVSRIIDFYDEASYNWRENESWADTYAKGTIQYAGGK